MQFIVPQFIDVEDKILGPLSVRQFILFLVGAGLIYIDYELMYIIAGNFWFFLISAVFLFGLTGLFAFFKVNGRPFHWFLLAIIVNFRDPKLRIWYKYTLTSDLKRKKEKVEASPEIPVKPGVTQSQLQHLALIVDTGGAFSEEDATEKKTHKA